MDSVKILKNKYLGLEVVLDRNRVVPDDPGADTPAIVYYKNKDDTFHATYWCAVGTTELLNIKGHVFNLSDSQLDWLNSLDEEINHFLYGDFSR